MSFACQCAAPMRAHCRRCRRCRHCCRWRPLRRPLSLLPPPTSRGGRSSLAARSTGVSDCCRADVQSLPQLAPPFKAVAPKPAPKTAPKQRRSQRRSRSQQRVDRRGSRLRRSARAAASPEEEGPPPPDSTRPEGGATRGSSWRVSRLCRSSPQPPALLHLGQARILPAHKATHAVGPAAPPNASRRQQSCVRVCERVRLLAMLAASAVLATATEHPSKSSLASGQVTPLTCSDNVGGGF